MSDAGRDWLAGLEGGYRLEAYLCPAGVWTISAGVTRYHSGKTGRVQKGDKFLFVDEAKALFSRVLKTYEAGVDGLTRDDLAQHEFDALVSFAYNVGVQAFANSTLVTLVNTRVGLESIGRQFARWVYADGVRVRGLALRRAAEAMCYATGKYPSYGDVEEVA